MYIAPPVRRPCRSHPRPRTNTTPSMPTWPSDYFGSPVNQQYVYLPPLLLHLSLAALRSRILQDPSENRFNIGLFPDNTKLAATSNGGRGPEAERMLFISLPPLYAGLSAPSGSPKPKMAVTSSASSSIARLPRKPYRQSVPCLQYVLSTRVVPTELIFPSAPNTKSQLIYASKFLNNGVFEKLTTPLTTCSPGPKCSRTRYRTAASGRRTSCSVVIAECLIRRYFLTLPLLPHRTARARPCSPSPSNSLASPASSSGLVSPTTSPIKSHFLASS